MKDFLLPDLGEGLTESELLEWHVAVGDTVTLNQTLAEVETAKAIVQLPSPFAGTIAKLYAEPGTTVAVGAPIVGFETDEAASPPARTPVLVGYGPAADTGTKPKRAPRKSNAPVPDEQPVVEERAEAHASRNLTSVEPAGPHHPASPQARQRPRRGSPHPRPAPVLTASSPATT